MADDYEVVVEEGYRTADVDGAKILAMGIVDREKGGISAFMEFDDEKGMATYNMTAKGAPVGAKTDDNKYTIPGYLDIGKVIASLKKLGISSFVNVDKKTWRTEPPILGHPIWIKCVVTSKEGEKEYKSLIDVVKVDLDGKVATNGSTKPATSGKPGTSTTPAKGDLTPELLNKWRDELGSILAEAPLNDTGITQAIKKKYPGAENEAFRKSLADVRVKALAALTKEEFVTMGEDAKYSLSV